MKKIRCAIYTRKSSEEGLEQDFNSLHAQREACAAYILSQASEGWSLLAEDYDDGGLSGGTLERPALQRLLADIEGGKIDIVVVYKVDRLTRSLLDFSKLVEAFDKAGTSFVSVTQSFNTTTSMGRLTLNMLLSFAQFEREVTAERIRDKIAASKAKGMWMGGVPPLGYRPDGRTLEIVEAHAAVIRDLFTRYLEQGNVPLLLADLEKDKIRVPMRHASTGRALGGGRFTRGQLYHILSNPIYVGEIHHGGRVHQGKHDAIIERELWDQVQAGLASNRQGKQRAASIKSPSVLAGLVFDSQGQPLVASHACKGKIRYRYYVSSVLQRAEETIGLRIPAKELEDAARLRVAEALDQPLALLAKLKAAPDGRQLKSAMRSAGSLRDRIEAKDRTALRSLISRIEVDAHELKIHLNGSGLMTELGLVSSTASNSDLTLTSEVKLNRSGQALRLIQPDGRKVSPHGPEQPLVDLLLKARKWWARLSEGDIDVKTLAREEGVNDSWMSRVIRLNFLAPDLVTAILSGQQSMKLTVATLTSGGTIPLRWEDQVNRFT